MSALSLLCIGALGLLLPFDFTDPTEEILEDYFWIEAGKRMAEDRFGFFLKFLDQFI